MPDAHPQTADAGPAGIVVVILAGGEGGRLGGAVKANLMLGGRRLVEHLVDILEEAGPVLVSIGRFDIGRIGVPPEATALPDLSLALRGPLAGILAATSHCLSLPRRPEFLLSAAVDTPLFPRDFVIRALDAIGDADAVVATSGGQDYFTNALWRLEAISWLPDAVTHGTAPASPKALLARLRVVRLDWPANPFLNINTPEDFERIKDLAAP